MQEAMHATNRWYGTVYIPWLVAFYDTHKGKRWLNSNPPKPQGLKPPYGGSDPLGMFPLFLKRTADVMAPRLSVVFRRLVHLGSFPACWRQANVTPIPKGPPFSSVANY